ncbi:hypothetical protein FMUAM8_04010 [Nocardia cyriacigeorgica]|nr:hypothetical protein FMUAM8_04010 [Nocardia cyriacigeorgica]BDU04129.1 hypothetical protein FMUBM48_03920 [Nocardia cyriacigeorgica]
MGAAAPPAWSGAGGSTGAGTGFVISYLAIAEIVSRAQSVPGRLTNKAKNVGVDCATIIVQ